MLAANELSPSILSMDWLPLNDGQFHGVRESKQDRAKLLTWPLEIHDPFHVRVGGTSDISHPGVPFETVAGLMGIMAAASWHTFQVSTRYPTRAGEFFAWLEAHPDRHLFDSAQLQERYPGDAWEPYLLADVAGGLLPDGGAGYRVELIGRWPLPNVWLGLEARNQKEVNAGISQLMGLPAACRWLRLEPLHEAVTLRWMSAWPENAPTIAMKPGHGVSTEQFDGLRRLDWVVVGGDVGRDAKPMHPDWVRTVRDECKQADVPFMFRQWGDWGQATGLHGNLINPSHGLRSDGRLFKLQSAGQALCGAAPMAKIGALEAGCVLDGQRHREMPNLEDLT